MLNDEKRQDAPERIKPETVAPKIVQEIKYRDRGVAKVPHSAQVNADCKTGAPLPSQTYYRAMLTLLNINQDANLLTYFDRQGRNENITLASQIAYNGSNISFVFYENQIRRLMEESPFEERKLEVLRASCVGQPRGMVNLFCAPMKSMSTSERIEKALSRLRQRYGVTAASEPKVKAVRHGPKVSFNSASLKMFIEDLNTLEVFAYAHDEPDKLSGQLLDTAGHLRIILKCRHLDYLDQLGLDMSQPGFESLRKFIVHEIAMMASK